MPSLSQRGILLCVLWSVTTWQNSCHSTDSQFAGRSPCEAGLLAVMTRPKQTPKIPAGDARHAERANVEIFLLGEDFDDDRDHRA